LSKPEPNPLVIMAMLLVKSIANLLPPEQKGINRPLRIFFG